MASQTTSDVFKVWHNIACLEMPGNEMFNCDDPLNMMICYEWTVFVVGGGGDL